MAKEITTSINVSIAAKGSSKASGSITTTEDAIAGFVGFAVTAGTAAASIPLGVSAPALVYIQNNDSVSTVTVDAVVGMTSWPQKIAPNTGVLLRPPNGTLYGKTNTGPAQLWIVAG